MQPMQSLPFADTRMWIATIFLSWWIRRLLTKICLIANCISSPTVAARANESAKTAYVNWSRIVELKNWYVGRLSSDDARIALFENTFPLLLFFVVFFPSLCSQGLFFFLCPKEPTSYWNTRKELASLLRQTAIRGDILSVIVTNVRPCTPSLLILCRRKFDSFRRKLIVVKYLIV